MKGNALLTVDAVINLALGILLLLFPVGVVRALGVPPSDTRFYPSILGAVLFGIGIALVLERMRPPQPLVGLGLGGAVAINLCGGVVLAGWLLVGNLALPTRGLVFLWSLVFVLVVLSLAELLAHLRRTPAGAAR